MSVQHYQINRLRKQNKFKGVFNRDRFLQAVRFQANRYNVSLWGFLKLRGVSENTFRKWTYNTHVPSLPRFKKACDLLDLRWNAFFFNNSDFTPSIDVLDSPETCLNGSSYLYDNIPETIFMVSNKLKKACPEFNCTCIFPNKEVGVCCIIPKANHKIPLRFYLYISCKEGLFYSLLEKEDNIKLDFLEQINLDKLLNNRAIVQSTYTSFSLFTEEQLKIYVRKIILEKNKYITNI